MNPPTSVITEGLPQHATYCKSPDAECASSKLAWFIFVAKHTYTTDQGKRGESNALLCFPGRAVKGVELRACHSSDPMR